MILREFFFRASACAITLFALLVPEATRADTMEAIEKAQSQLLDPRQSRSAEMQLKRLTSSRDETICLRSRVVLARHKRQQGAPSDAYDLVESYSELTPQHVEDPWIEGLIESALCQGALNKNVSAYKLLDYAKQNAKGIPGALVRVALADMVEAVPDLKKAMDYLQEALKYGDNYFLRKKIQGESVGEASRMEAAKPGHEKWPKLRQEILDRISDLERRLRIEKWGLDYVLYQEAQEARKPNDPFAEDFCSLGSIYSGSPEHENIPSSGANYALALKKYDQIIEKFPKGVFAEASKLYRCICLAKQGRTDDAIKDLTAFYKESPTGLYRGEALKLLGDIALQDGWDLEVARKHFEAALTWCKQSRLNTHAALLYAVPEKCAAPASSPDQWQEMDSHGVISGKNVPSGAVINRTTTSWYLNRLQEDLLFRIGYVHAVMGDWETAQQYFQQSTVFDPLLAKAEQKNYFNLARRVRGACEKESFIGEKEESRGLTGKTQACMMWADLMYLQKRFEQAESLYTRLYHAAVKKNDTTVGARAGLGVILVLHQEGKSAQVKERAEDVSTRWPKSPYAPYALMLAGLATGPDKDHSYAGALALFRDVYTRYPRTRFAEWARFEEIFRGINSGNLEEHRDWIESFYRDYPRSKYLKAIESNVQLLEKWAAKKGNKRD